ncbi:thiolase family protein [Rhodococcus opacus]|uniref:thiolase family protein n=1 Tax=Rhodococcus opacus TaxID=37919 RepID=UPI000A952AC6|nr:thiolase family protein [Rhodococcus opacus]
MSSLSRDVAIVGVGYSPFSLNGLADPRRRACLACTGALDDAELIAEDVDAMYHYHFEDDIPVSEVARMLGIKGMAIFGDLMITGPSGLVCALEAVTALASSAVETALAFRSMVRATGYAGAVSSDTALTVRIEQNLAPYGWSGILTQIAMRKRRRIAEPGGAAEDYGPFALNTRLWAALNPGAVLREQLKMEEHLSGRTVPDPLSIFDCDYPINGACAVTVTTEERANARRSQRLHVDSIAYSSGTAPDSRWICAEDFLFGGTSQCANRLWSRPEFTAADIDVAQYGGFTYSRSPDTFASGTCRSPASPHSSCNTASVRSWSPCTGPSARCPPPVFAGSSHLGPIRLPSSTQSPKSSILQKPRVSIEVTNAFGLQCADMVVKYLPEIYQDLKMESTYGTRNRPAATAVLSHEQPRVGSGRTRFHSTNTGQFELDVRGIRSGRPALDLATPPDRAGCLHRAQHGT